MSFSSVIDFATFAPVHPTSAGLRRSLQAFLMLCETTQPFPVQASVPARWVLDFHRRLTVRRRSASLSSEARATRLMALIERGLDTDAFGQTMLDWRWRAATAEQRQAFDYQLRRFLAEQLADDPGDLGSRPLVVVAVHAEKNASTVITELPGVKGSASLHVDWRLASETGRLRLSDVMVEGVSLAATLRPQFEGAPDPVTKVMVPKGWPLAGSRGSAPGLSDEELGAVFRG